MSSPLATETLEGNESFESAEVSSLNEASLKYGALPVDGENSVLVSPPSVLVALRPAGRHTGCVHSPFAFIGASQCTESSGSCDSVIPRHVIKTTMSVMNEVSHFLQFLIIFLFC